MKRQIVRIVVLVAIALTAAVPTVAQPAPTPVEKILLAHSDVIQKSSRRTIQPAIDALRDSGLAEAGIVLARWGDRDLWVRVADGRFFLAEKTDADADRYTLRHVVTGEVLGKAGEDAIEQVRPNLGIRRLILAARVPFQLLDPDPGVRRDSLAAIERDPKPAHVPALRRAIEAEDDPTLKRLMEQRARILSITFAETTAERVQAIESLSNDVSREARATLNPLLSTRRIVTRAIPDDANVAARLEPGSGGFSEADAYALLVDKGHAAPVITAAARDQALKARITEGSVAGVSVASLDTRAARDAVYDRLAAAGDVPPRITAEERAILVDEFLFVDVYQEAPEITAAALGTMDAIDARVNVNRAADLVLDALSLASIYFLAAIGLAITFGVMGVINMAHGEFIMMGAYTGYVVQLFVPNYTASLIVALPLAFAVAFLAGVVLERFVIRWLYHRPLETLLATFGVSIALQQLAKNIFGTQARPLTAPGWLDGALVFNDVLAISYIRVAIFALALGFFAILIVVLNRTRLGLEVRAVRQNPRMAESMGINRERVNMLTFGLGSGIAGVAGVAIGLFAQVTSDVGSKYIVQSFMTVVVGGVGNIFGTLAGATLIGFLQKFIESLNPGNTLAAQTYMVIFIIIFIQFRPRGIIALRGRAADA